MTKVEKARDCEQGFTLVELAIVMVIIGLLIGGVLKGQELISNAKVTATATQLKGTDAAMNTFYDKYLALPGDIQSPSTRIANCTGDPCGTASTTGTAGDGKIQSNALTTNAVIAPLNTSEAYRLFPQLAAADLITGITQSNGNTFGGAYPAIKSGGGMWVAYNGTLLGSAPASPPRNINVVARKHYATLAGQTSDVSLDNGTLSASTAAQLDRKLDDGLPFTGNFQTLGTNCWEHRSDGEEQITYTESGGSGTCTSFMRVLN